MTEHQTNNWFLHIIFWIVKECDPIHVQGGGGGGGGGMQNNIIYCVALDLLFLGVGNRLQLERLLDHCLLYRVPFMFFFVLVINPF